MWAIAIVGVLVFGLLGVVAYIFYLAPGCANRLD
jgi:hypothetical protein